LVSYSLTLHNGFVDYVFTEYSWNALDGLASGALVAIALRMFQLERRHLLSIAIIAMASGATIWMCGWPFGIWTTQRPVGAMFQTSAWNIAFAGLLLAFLLCGSSTWKNLVLNRGLRFFGYISYGLYLIHILLFDAYDELVKRFYPSVASQPEFRAICFRFLVASAASIAIAYASRRWFENPFLRLKDKQP
jgi:peptidoglycan/LPS O-acetylase OafA/YrhL